MITTYVNSHTKKIRQSFLHKMYNKDSFGFPSGAVLLAIYAVYFYLYLELIPLTCVMPQTHIALSQFDTGEFLGGSFAEDAAPKLLNSHRRNLKYFTEEDKADFLESVTVFAPKTTPFTRPSSAFTSVPVIASFYC